ncbi:MAG: hypothetical protein IIB38_14040 [Candidatus Hydrogenedentes bacterium]|nr:hypothetical protein [Candidatus Hydrogenedentota bacterium]
MPRRKLIYPTKAVTFRIDEGLAAQYELLLLDPVANRGSYGKKSLIVEALLRRLIDAARNGDDSIDVVDLTKFFFH